MKESPVQGQKLTCKHLACDVMKRLQVKANASGPSPLIISESESNHSPQTWETLTDTFQSSKTSLHVILTPHFGTQDMSVCLNYRWLLATKVAFPLSFILSLSTVEFASYRWCSDQQLKLSNLHYRHNIGSYVVYFSSTNKNSSKQKEPLCISTILS